MASSRDPWWESGRAATAKTTAQRPASGTTCTSLTMTFPSVDRPRAFRASGGTGQPAGVHCVGRAGALVTERELHSGNLRLRAAARDGVATLALEGELDLASVPALEQAVDGALNGAGNVGTLELQLSRVTFMDSTGLRALLTVRERAEKAGRRLRL